MQSKITIHGLNCVIFSWTWIWFCSFVPRRKSQVVVRYDSEFTDKLYRVLLCKSYVGLIKMYYNCIVVGNVAWLVNSVIKYHVFCLCFLVCSTNQWKPSCWIIQSLILAANAIVTTMVLSCNCSYAVDFDILTKYWQIRSI